MVTTPTSQYVDIKMTMTTQGCPLHETLVADATRFAKKVPGVNNVNIEIVWESGKKDYLFQGVMGFQRISKDKDQSYTSGLRKSLD